MIALLALQLFTPVDPKAIAPLYEQAFRDGPTAAAARDAAAFLRNNNLPGARDYAAKALALDEAARADAAQLAADRELLATVSSREEAIGLLKEAAKSPDATTAARCLTQLGGLTGDVAFYRQALAKEETPVRLVDLGLALEARSEYKEAEPLLRRALAMHEKKLGPAHPQTAATMNNLASLLLATGRAAQAEPLQRRSLKTLEDALGSNHVRVGVGASNLADILAAKGDAASAKPLYRRAYEIFNRALGPTHAWTRDAATNVK